MTYGKVRDFTPIYAQFSIISRRRMAVDMSKPSGTKLVYVMYFLEKTFENFSRPYRAFNGQIFWKNAEKKSFFYRKHSKRCRKILKLILNDFLEQERMALPFVPGPPLGVFLKIENVLETLLLNPKTLSTFSKCNNLLASQSAPQSIHKTAFKPPRKGLTHHVYTHPQSLQLPLTGPNRVKWS